MSANSIITFDIPSFKGGTFFAGFWTILERRKAPIEKKIKALLLESARDGHRLSSKGRHYIPDTGKIQLSTKVKGGLGRNDLIELFVVVPEVPYVQFVMNITKNKNWGDPFIDEALEYNKPAIMKMIRDLYNASINEFNALP